MKNMILQELIEKRIFMIRGEKVMFDSDLAKLYGVPTKSLNLAVKRNINRFPKDFMFRLDKDEQESLRFQFETSKTVRGGRRYLSYVFTQEGVAMLSSVLNSEKAIQVNIAIMRVFVKLKQLILTHKEFGYKLAELERKLEKHDVTICSIFEAIRQLMAPPPEEAKPKIGFK